MIAMPGIETIGIVALVAIVVFGGAKIPELARSLGRAKGEFQKGLSEGNASKDAAKPDKEPAKTDDAS
jgi:sec-independent protein translocase protein TatA